MPIPDPIEPEGYPDTPRGDSGAPGPSYAVDLLRAVAMGALLVIAAGLVLDAPPALTGDQRLLIAGLAAVLAALLGLSVNVYRRPR